MSTAKFQKYFKEIVFEESILGNRLKFYTTPGLFSDDRIDTGTRVLIESFQVKGEEKIIDIGCGYGPVGIAIAKAFPKTQVHMIDRDFVAVEYARKNSEINKLKNVGVYLSNGFSHVEDVDFDMVASNIPTHAGKEPIEGILAGAYDHMNKGAKLYVVTVAKLESFIGRLVTGKFGNSAVVEKKKGYVVTRATR